MKRISFLLAAALMMVVSCQDVFTEIDFQEAPSFEAEMETFDHHTKTSLTENNGVVWTKGDEVSIFRGSTIGNRYRLNDASAEQSNATFSAVAAESDLFSAGTELPANIALYPYSPDVTASAASKGFRLNNVVLPAVQNYSEDSFGNGAFAMVAVTRNLDDRILSFRNVLGAMRLQIKGSAVVKSITITGNNDEKLSGDAEITAGVDVYEPTITMKNTAGTSVKLDCGEGVLLNSTMPTDFIIALPPVTFSKGFTVEVKDADDVIYTIEANVTNVVQRSCILNMPVVTLEGGELSGSESTDPIVFADPAVKARCVELYDKDGDGELSYMEAAAVTSLNGLFASYSTYKYVGYYEETDQMYEGEGYRYGYNYSLGPGPFTFDELQYFTGLREIDPYAFYGSNISQLTLPSGIKRIGANAFFNCPITELEFPEGIREILSVPENLTSLNVPEGVTRLRASLYIGNKSQLFDNTTADYKISLPKTLKELNLLANVNYNFEGTITYSGSALASDGISYVNEDGRLIYYDNRNLTEYVIPEGVKTIGYFYTGNIMTSVTFPQTLEEPEENVLRYFGTVTEISGKYVASDGKSMISGNRLIGVLPSVDEYAIPENITVIGRNAFYNTLIEEIEIPSTVKTLEYGAFGYCNALETVVLPQSITEIPNDCFYGCTSLSRINLNNVKVLGRYAFYDCNKLLSRLVIPGSIEEIGFMALYKNYGTCILEFQASLPPVLKSGWVPDEQYSDSYVRSSKTFSPQTMIYVPDLALSKYASYAFSEIWPQLSVIGLSNLYADPEIDKSPGYDQVRIAVNGDFGDVEYTLLRVFVDPERNTFERKHPLKDEYATVKITKDFYIGEIEVPKILWKAVMYSYPGKFPNPDYYETPVEGVSVEECLAFIDRLNELTGLEFRLPTEAEWEFAARGGSLSQGYKFAGSDDWNEVYAVAESDGAPAPARSKKANELGLYDMNGNVWEYCSDYYYGWDRNIDFPRGEDPYVDKATAMEYNIQEFGEPIDLGLVYRGGDVRRYHDKDGFVATWTNRRFNTAYFYGGGV